MRLLAGRTSCLGKDGYDGERRALYTHLWRHKTQRRAEVTRMNGSCGPARRLQASSQVYKALVGDQRLRSILARPFRDAGAGPGRCRARCGRQFAPSSPEPEGERALKRRSAL